MNDSFKDQIHGRLEQLYKQLSVKELVPFNAMQYLLSGGLSYRCLVPNWSFSFIRSIDQCMSSMKGLFPISMIACIEKA